MTTQSQSVERPLDRCPVCGERFRREIGLVDLCPCCGSSLAYEERVAPAKLATPRSVQTWNLATRRLVARVGDAE